MRNANTHWLLHLCASGDFPEVLEWRRAAARIVTKPEFLPRPALGGFGLDVALDNESRGLVPDNNGPSRKREGMPRPIAIRSKSSRSIAPSRFARPCTSPTFPITNASMWSLVIPTEPMEIAGLPVIFFAHPARLRSVPNSGYQKRRCEQWNTSTPASTSRSKRHSKWFGVAKRFA
jgi:hypothetical protein